MKIMVNKEIKNLEYKTWDESTQSYGEEMAVELLQDGTLTPNEYGYYKMTQEEYEDAIYFLKTTAEETNNKYKEEGKTELKDTVTAD